MRPIMARARINNSGRMTLVRSRCSVLAGFQPVGRASRSKVSRVEVVAGSVGVMV